MRFSSVKLSASFLFGSFVTVWIHLYFCLSQSLFTHLFVSIYLPINSPIYLCDYLCLFVCMYVCSYYMYASIPLYICSCLFILSYIPINSPIYLSICLSINQSICPPICPLVYQFIYLSTYRLVNQSVYLSTSPLICQPVHLPVRSRRKLSINFRHLHNPLSELSLTCLKSSCLRVDSRGPGGVMSSRRRALGLLIVRGPAVGGVSSHHSHAPFFAFSPLHRPIHTVLSRCHNHLARMLICAGGYRAPACFEICSGGGVNSSCSGNW